MDSNCIGHVEPLEILEVLEFLQKKKKGELYYPSFRDKIVVDFGAGISDFANTLLSVSSPKKVIAVDSMYESEETYTAAIEYTLECIKKSAEKIAEMPDSVDKDYNIRVNQRQERLLNQTFPHHSYKIIKRSSVKSLGNNSCDYVFMTDVYSGVYDCVGTLNTIGRIIKPKGKLYIIENPQNYTVNPAPINMLKDSINEKDGGVECLFWHSGLLDFLLNGKYLKNLKSIYR